MMMECNGKDLISGWATGQKPSRNGTACDGEWDGEIGSPTNGIWWLRIIAAGFGIFKMGCPMISGHVRKSNSFDGLGHGVWVKPGAGVACGDVVVLSGLGKINQVAPDGWPHWGGCDLGLPAQPAHACSFVARLNGQFFYFFPVFSFLRNIRSFS